MAAVQRGNARMVRLLVEKRAQVPRDPRDHSEVEKVDFRPIDLTVCHYSNYYSIRFTMVYESMVQHEVVYLLYVIVYQARAARVGCGVGSHEVDQGQQHEAPLLAAIHSQHVDIARCLADAQADVQRTSSDGMTPLHAAAAQGHLPMVEFLVKAKASADVNKADATGDTPLLSSIWLGFSEVVRFLIECRADADVADKSNNTPLHAAATQGDVAIVGALLQARADPDRCNDDGETALFTAVWSDHLEAVQQLLKAGADMHVLDGRGSSVAHIAARLGRAPLVNALLEAGADMQRLDSLILSLLQGWTQAVVTIQILYERTVGYLCPELHSKHCSGPCIARCKLIWFA